MRQASLAHLGMVRYGTLNPGLALNLCVLLFHKCHDYDLWGNNSPSLGVRVTGSEASVYPSMAYEVPERSQGCCSGRGGEMAVGRWAGLVSFLSPTPTGLRLMLAEVAGAAWLSLVPALSNRSLAPLAALFGEFEPCQEAPITPSHPPQEQKGGPTAIWVSETAGVTSWARPRPAGAGRVAGFAPIMALSGGASCWTIEWTQRPRATYSGSEQESFGKQARDKITVTWGQ